MQDVQKQTINQDIRLSVTVKVSLAIISWIYTIKLVLESAHQTIPDDI